ncbi:cell envelope integrity protein CreD [Oceanispirochaeta crateris]|nr:cell envelope integrity protein CreD [Oceanispirochaeta crateris]
MKDIKNKDISRQDWKSPLLHLGRSGSPSFGFKVIFIIIMIFLFLIPLGMIKDLIWERESRKMEAREDVVSSWGGRSALGGPVLVIPRRIEREFLEEGGKSHRTEEYIENVYLLPRSLDMEIHSRNEMKYRGIFEIPVFTLDLNSSGEFSLEALYKHYNPANLLWDQAYLQFSYHQLKGMKKTEPLLWGGREIDFEPGDNAQSFYNAALKVPVDIGSGEIQNISRIYPFRFNQQIQGGTSLEFLPLGGVTKVLLESDWGSPSFQGYYLPGEQSITETGFSAEWELHSLSRGIPETWMESDASIFQKMRETAFGLTYYPELDSYSKTRRTVDYGILFLTIPFLTFFLFELISKVRIHPIQYLLAGFGNILFYLILLSLSEHTGFSPSYLIASLSVTALLSLYTLTIAGIGWKGLTLIPVMAAGYGYLFFVLKSEDYALLMGTAGLFAALAITMFLTRKIQWYD